MRALLPCLLAACSSSAAAPAPSAIVITNLGPGRFALENPTRAPLRVTTAATLERQTATGWVSITDHLDLGAGYRLLAACAPTPPACAEIAAGAELRPVPWTGRTCSAQCNHTCRGNTYEAAGTYRLVVTPCDGGPALAGPPFELPGATAAPWDRLGLATGVTAATAVRLEERNGPPLPGTPTVAGHAVRPQSATTLDRDALATLLALVHDPKSYRAEVGKRRVSPTIVGFRLTRTLASTGTPRTEVVDVSLEIEGKWLTFGTGSDQVFGFIDDNRAAWLAFAKQLFPADADLAAIR